MEDVYTIKVKTKPDTRNLYPSERRYSASTVSGLAWVHIALAATSLLLAFLALVNPTSEVKRLTLNDTKEVTVDRDELIFNLTQGFNNTRLDEENVSLNETKEPLGDGMSESTINKENISEILTDYSFILVLAPTIITVFASAAGMASIMASVRWYVDKNITWLFIVSVLSTMASLVAFVMVIGWFGHSEGDMSQFYKDKIPFQDIIILKHSDVILKNDTHLIVAKNSTMTETDSKGFTKRVLSINILIAAFLELLWSILSVKIAYKGMKNSDRDDGNDRRGNCIEVVTTIKGNGKNLPRNGKLVPPKPELIEQYPASKKIKRIFLAQSDNGFYLKNENKPKPNTETSSEFYKERMINYLNKCASLEAISNPELATPSVQSEATQNYTQEVISADINDYRTEDKNMTPISWGDTPEHPVYNQSTIIKNFDNIFNFQKKIQEAEESDNTQPQGKK